MEYGSQMIGDAEDRSRPVASTRGRDREVAVFDGAIERVNAGQFQAVFIEGDAGIGKTHLLRRAVRAAESEGFVSLEIQCEEVGRRWPLHVIETTFENSQLPQQVDGLAADVLAAVRTRRSSGAAPIDTEGAFDQRVAELVLDLVDSLCVRGPVTLAVDDLQWADEATLELLAVLSARLRHHPILFLNSFRSGPRPQPFDAFMASGVAGSTHLRLSGLHPDDAAALAGDVLGAPPMGRLRAKVESAGGNPFFIIELVRALTDEGSVVFDERGADAVDTSLPASLRATLLRRVGSFPAPTVDVLRVASVFGKRFRIQHVARAAGVRAGELVARLALVVGAGVVEEFGEELRFRHDLVRAAIYEEMPLAFRQSLHAEAARALSACGADVAEIFEHVAASATVGDDATIEWLLQTAEQSPGSPQVAVRMLERAVVLTGSDGRRRAMIQTRLVSALVAAGSLIAAERLARDVLEQRVDAETAARARSGLGRALFYRGAFEAAAAELGRAADASGSSRDAMRDRAMAALSNVFLRAPDALDRSLAALEAGELGGDLVAMTYATTAIAEHKRTSGYLAESATAARRAGDLARQVWRDSTLPPVVVPAGHLVAAGYLDEAEDVLRSGYWAETETSAVMQPVRQTFLAGIRYIRGEWSDAVAEAETALAWADDVGTQWNTASASAILSRIAAHQGNLQSAESHLQAIAAGTPGTRMWPTAVVLALRSDVKELSSHLARMRTHITESVEAYVSLDLARRDFVRFYLEIGDRATAKRLAELADLLAERAGVGWIRAEALYVRGLLEDDDLRLVEAARGFQAASMLPAMAESYEAAGKVLAARDSAAAIGPLTEAAAMYERMGADTDVARVDRALRDIGVRRGRRGSRSRPGTGWDSLTARERSVAESIRRGLTYREIANSLYISKRTVETHAVRIFGKLGVSGRRDLERLPGPSAAEAPSAQSPYVGAARPLIERGQEP